MITGKHAGLAAGGENGDVVTGVVDIGTEARADEPVDEAVRGVPAPALRGLVGWYSGYRQSGLPVARHRGLPSPWLTLILTLDDPLSVAAHPDPAAAPGDYLTLLGGLHTAPALIAVPGRQSGVQIALSPLGARSLLGLPGGALAGIDVHADDVLGADAREVHERLRAAAGWPERFAVVDAWLVGRLLRGDADSGRIASVPPPEAVRAWRLLVATGGRVRVDSLAAEVGWSARHLQSRFVAEFGLSPKAAARVVRFDLARRALAARPDRPDLAGLAADCGYADQSHLDREFAALAGCSPSAWLAEEFRNIQSGHHPAS
ncbi:AraC family transcriptional regulator [Streptacidiphilus fuscans]|uniref:AraC family transcriptional regulator n=1 Tax=Streptacidiphilus fuscans TaxID=2789292 RepID=UPI002E28B331|nr:helix-turn-helix domain-containing protein [Streptacidiphilus fuscans]